MTLDIRTNKRKRSEPVDDIAWQTARIPEFAYADRRNEGLLVLETARRTQWTAGQEKQDREARIEAMRRRAEAIHERVNDGLKSLSAALAAGKSEQFLEFLTCIGKFHQYSWGNTILIAFQRPDATQVSGFNTWKALGRYVKPGEKGIAILAPILRRVRTESATAESPVDSDEVLPDPSVCATAVRAFRVVYIFDVSQTDGKPLPTFAESRGAPGDYLPRLREHIRGSGIDLVYSERLGGAMGRSFGGKIEVLSGLQPASEFSVLVHELAHELLHPLTERAQIPRTIKETEAEAIAYVVGQAVGLEPTSASSDYIQLYQGSTSTLAASLERIQKTATRILSYLDNDPT